MLLQKSFENATYARRFLPAFNNAKMPTQQVIDLLNDRRNLEGMAFVTENIEFPALGAVVKKLEGIPEVERYFRTTSSKDTLKFRQFVGMAVRLALEEIGFKTTGRKGYIGTVAKYFTRAEIFTKG